VTVLTLTDRSDRWSDKDLVVFSRYTTLFSASLRFGHPHRLGCLSLDGTKNVVMTPYGLRKATEIKGRTFYPFCNSDSWDGSGKAHMSCFTMDGRIRSSNAGVGSLNSRFEILAPKMRYSNTHFVILAGRMALGGHSNSAFTIVGCGMGYTDFAIMGLRDGVFEPPF
jgi:hypothetical protein